MSETPVQTLSPSELERLLLGPEAPPGGEWIAVSAASVAKLASQAGLLDELVRRFRFTGTLRTDGEPVLSFEPKRLLLALTLDYETWQPLPPGVTIDWQRDVFEPARRFAALAEAASARVTFFVEMGEYVFLQTFEPRAHSRMDEQLQRLVAAGHAVELHLHPDWLPELGARRDGDDWHWDCRYAHAHDYPGDLGELLLRCKRALERAVSAEGERYAVRAFRAGAYRAQPFTRLSTALAQAGIACDSSVFRGGVSTERGYDYTHAFSAHQPYLCSPDDPQLAARPGGDSVVELPIATLEFGRRWSVDGADQGAFGDDLLRLLAATQDHATEDAADAALWQARRRITAVLHRLSRGHLRQLPRQPAYSSPSELRHGHDYYVAIGHTKGEHDFDLLAAQLDRINRATHAEWVTLGTMAKVASEDLSRTEEWRAVLASATPGSVSVAAELAPPTDEALAMVVERVLPWVGSETLVLGDRAGRVAAILEPRFPWKRFVVSDAGPAAMAAMSDERFPTAVLAHDGPVAESTLKRWAAALSPQGRLVVPVAHDPRRLAYPQLPSARTALIRESRFQLEAAGFAATRAIECEDGFLTGIVVATPEKPLAPRDHFHATMGWLYSQVEPADDPATGHEPRQVLMARRALCLGYASALGAILERDGFQVEYATLVARDHERGRPPHGVDSHEVLQVQESKGRPVVLDPMANVLIPFGLLEVLREPSLAVANASPDDRYRTRRYELYSTSYLYERAFEICLRPSLDVISYDPTAGWRARLKVLIEADRRKIYRKRAGTWQRVPLALSPRPEEPEP